MKCICVGEMAIRQCQSWVRNEWFASPGRWSYDIGPPSFDCYIDCWEPSFLPTLDTHLGLSVIPAAGVHHLHERRNAALLDDRLDVLLALAQRLDLREEEETTTQCGVMRF